MAELLKVEEQVVADLFAVTRVQAVDSALVQRARLLAGMPPKQAAQRLIGDFLSYIPTVMFLLLPLFALVLKLLYVRRRRFYAEHYIFLLHVHSFVYLIFAVLLVMRGFLWLPGLLVVLLIGRIGFYIYLAMKRVYGQGWFRTLVKYMALGWAYVAILAFSVPAALLMSVLLV